MSVAHPTPSVAGRFGFDINRCMVFDVECYPGRWLVGFLTVDAAGKAIHFVVENDPQKLADVLERIAAHDRTLVGYNSNDYDKVMLLAIVRGYDAYEINLALIEKTALPADLDRRQTPLVLPCDHIDLAARLRRGGSIPSLKLTAARLGRPRLQELPFPPGESLDDEQWNVVKEYNLVDLKHTWSLLGVLTPELESLSELSREQDRDLRSTPTPKVCELVLTGAFEDATGHRPVRIEPPEAVTYTPVAGVRRPTTTQAAEWYDLLTTTTIPIIGPEERRTVVVPKVVVEIAGRKYKLGSGGLHSIDAAQVYYRTKRYGLVSIDVASYYPSLISKKGISPWPLGEVGLDTYRGILGRRLDLKRRAAEASDPEERRRLDVQSAALKLIQNSYFGKFGDSWSVLYDPEAMLRVTISGQLMLIDLIERVTAAGIEVLTANTDGLVLRVRRSEKAEKRLARILRGWQDDTELLLEIEDLQRLATLATNQYAVLSARHKIKRKGSKLKGDLSPLTTPNALVVNDAVVDALLRDIPPERTIRGCRDLVRFCSITTRSGKCDSLVIRDPSGVEVDAGKVQGQR